MINWQPDGEIYIRYLAPPQEFNFHENGETRVSEIKDKRQRRRSLIQVDLMQKVVRAL